MLMMEASIWGITLCTSVLTFAFDIRVTSVHHYICTPNEVNFWSFNIAVYSCEGVNIHSNKFASHAWSQTSIEQDSFRGCILAICWLQGDLFRTSSIDIHWMEWNFSQEYTMNLRFSKQIAIKCHQGECTRCESENIWIVDAICVCLFDSFP